MMMFARDLRQAEKEFVFGFRVFQMPYQLAKAARLTARSRVSAHRVPKASDQREILLSFGRDEIARLVWLDQFQFAHFRKRRAHPAQRAPEQKSQFLAYQQGMRGNLIQESLREWSQIE